MTWKVIRQRKEGGVTTSSPQLVTSELKRAVSAQVVLSVVKKNLHDLNHIHVSVAFSTLGKISKSRNAFSPRRQDGRHLTRDFSLRPLTDDKAFQELLRLAREFARTGTLESQTLSVTLHGIAQLHAAGRVDSTNRDVDDTLSAMEAAIVQLESELIAQNVTNIIWSLATLGRMPGNEAWAALETAAEREAPEMIAKGVSSAAWAYARLGRMPRDETWTALETAMTRVAPTMGSQGVTNTIYAYAMLKQMPGEDVWNALEIAARRVAPELSEQGVSNTWWAYAALNRAPGDDTWAALETAARRLAQNMKAQAVANTTWAFATLERAPEASTLANLETAAARAAAWDMDQQELGITFWAFSKLGRVPRPATWTALEARTVRLTSSLSSQAVANILSALALSGRVPEADAWTALETAAGREVGNMLPQEVANTLWAYSTLFTLRDADLPSCYGALWDVVRGFEVRDFSYGSIRMLFHVFLMHEFSNRDRSSVGTYPEWLLKEGGDMWKRQARDRTTFSGAHHLLAAALKRLGVQHELERVTDDGYFSIDIYLPEYDVAVEVDGPSHYYNEDDASSSPDDGDVAICRTKTRTRTTKTELRDFFLAKQCAKVLTVPFFEFDGLFPETMKERVAYVRGKLDVAGIAIRRRRGGGAKVDDDARVPSASS